MNKNNLYCLTLILLLATALLLKTCSKEAMVNSPLTSYTDSLEIENRTLITLAEKNNNEIKKLEIDKLVIQEQLGRLNNNILLIKAEYKKEYIRVKFLDNVESVDYLSKRITSDSVLVDQGVCNSIFILLCCISNLFELGIKLLLSFDIWML